MIPLVSCVIKINDYDQQVVDEVFMMMNGCNFFIIMVVARQKKVKLKLFYKQSKRCYYCPNRPTSLTSNLLNYACKNITCDTTCTATNSLVVVDYQC